MSLCSLDLRKNADSRFMDSDPDERPSAVELIMHPYLALPPGWTFSGFARRDSVLEDDGSF